MDLCREWIGVAVAVALAAAGCSHGPVLAPVSGRVTLDGTPLDCGGVMFQPDAGPAALAPIGRDGRFTLRYQGRADGAVVGRNRVVVTAYESERPGFEQPAGGEPVIGRSLVPEQYTSAATTDLEVDVRPGMGDVELTLSSQP